MCGLPVTPFECMDVVVHHVDTLDDLLDKIIDSLGADGITVLFVASVNFLRTCLHRVAYFKSRCMREVKFLVGTSFDMVRMLAPLCKAENVPIRSTSRIVELQLTPPESVELYIGSLLKQYGSRALMARIGFKEDHAQAGLAVHNRTEGADVYFVNSYELGTFLLLIFGHTDLAWDAYCIQQTWWPLHVHSLNASLFKDHKQCRVQVTRLSVPLQDAHVDDIEDDSLIDFLP